MEIDTNRVIEPDPAGDLVGPDEPALSPEVDAAAMRIRNHMTQTVENIIAIGRDLILVKERLDHGVFRAWVQAECRLSHSTASRMMQMARRFGDGRFITVTNLDPSVVYALAAPSTPDEVVEKALQQAEDGKSISRKSIAEMKRQLVDPAQIERTSHHAAAEKTADPEPIDLMNITTAELVAELERRAAGEDRDDVLPLLQQWSEEERLKAAGVVNTEDGTEDYLLDNPSFPRRDGKSTDATGSRDDTKPKDQHDAPVVDPRSAEQERSAPRPHLETASPVTIIETPPTFESTDDAVAWAKEHLDQELEPKHPLSTLCSRILREVNKRNRDAAHVVPDDAAATNAGSESRASGWD